MRLFRTDYNDQSDEKLMQLVAKGDAKAFEVVYDRYSRPMLNYFHRMLWKDREKAEDFMQDIFTKIVHKPEQYNPERPFKTWLYSVANNMCKNEYRKQEIRKPTGYELNEDVAVSDNGIDMHRAIDNKNFDRALTAELEKLDEKKRETFVLRYRQELSIKEIAEVCGISEGTVKSRLFYTLKQLSQTLKVFDPAQREI